MTKENEDFFKFLDEFNLGEREVLLVSRNVGDQVHIDKKKYGLELRSSPIQGIGVFTLNAHKKGSNIGPARIGSKRTFIGRYTNHSHDPNSEMVANLEGNIDLMAKRDVASGDELTVDYRDAVNLSRYLANQSPHL